MRIKETLIFAAVLAFFSCYTTHTDPLTTGGTIDSTLTPVSVFADALANQTSNIQVKQLGTIVAVLSDDTTGDRHQRFIVELSNGQTLLIAHNIDLAPRVPSPRVGNYLKFYGEYEWNSEGGVIHWTHKDPAGVHVDGWLEYEGDVYQ